MLGTATRSQILGVEHKKSAWNVHHGVLISKFTEYCGPLYFCHIVHSPSHIELLVVSDYLIQLFAGLFAVAGVEKVPERNWSLECTDHIHPLTFGPPNIK